MMVAGDKHGAGACCGDVKCSECCLPIDCPDPPDEKIIEGHIRAWGLLGAPLKARSTRPAPSRLRGVFAFLSDYRLSYSHPHTQEEADR